MRGSLFFCPLSEYQKQTHEEKTRFELVFFQKEVYGYPPTLKEGEIVGFWPGFRLVKQAIGYRAEQIM